MAEVVVKQGDMRSIRFRVETEAGNRLDMTTTICFLGIKENVNESQYVIQKNNDDFDKNLGNGLVSVQLSSADTFIAPGRYPMELKVIFADGSIVRNTKDFYLVIKKSVVHLNTLPSAGAVAAVSGAVGETTIT